MLPDVRNLNLYFDSAEYLALRTALLIFLVQTLYRIMRE